MPATARYTVEKVGRNSSTHSLKKNRMSEEANLVKKIGGGIVAVIVLVILLSTFTIVRAGQKAVVLNWGAYNGKTLEPGLHWLVPFRDKSVKMDTTVLKQEADVNAATKDLQDVTTHVALNHRIDPAHVADVYVSLTRDYETRVVVPSLQESVKAATAKYTAEELITKRAEVREEIKKLLTDKLAPHHMLVDDFNIINFSFSASFSQSIEKKVTAEQDALASKNKLEQTKYEAEQTVVSAKAQAESIKIQAEAIQQQGGENYVNLKAIEKWDGKLPTQFVPGSALPFVTLK